MRRILGIVCLIMLLLAGVTAGAVEEYRGFWVDAFNKGFKNMDEIKKLVKDVRDANCNVVFIEVRKFCDAYYNSAYEPKSSDIAPGFDPLKEVIKLCHDTADGKSFIEVHAWLVTYRSKIGAMKIPEGLPKHISIAHPEWISQDINGNKSPGKEEREYLDQGVPGVIEHNVNVVMDIVKNYDVDGIHFDYIRYAELTNKQGYNIWGYNPITVERFNRLYKKSGQPEPSDPQWISFRHRQIADLLRKVYASVKEVKPQVKVSAATVNWGGVNSGFKNSDPYKTTLQNWVGWMADGMLDINCLMNYKSAKQSQGDFKAWTKLLGSSKNGRHVINGLGAYMNPAEGTLNQIDISRSISDIDGVIFFSYAEISNNKTSRDAFINSLKNGAFKKPAEIPAADWISNPKTGIIKGTVKAGNEPVDGAAVVTDKGQELRTDGTGFYAFLNLEPGTYKLKLVFSDKSFDIGEVNVLKGKVATLDYTLSSN